MLRGVVWALGMEVVMSRCFLRSVFNCKSWMMAVAVVAALGCSSESSKGEDVLDTHTEDSTGDVTDLRSPEDQTDQTVPDLAQDVPDVAVDAGDLAQPDATELVQPDSVDVQDDEVTPVDWPEIPTGAGVALEVQSENPLTPFPFDWYLVDDASTPTGRRVEVTDPTYAPALLVGLFGMGSGYAPDLERMDGFGSYANFFIPVNTAMNPETLPAQTSEGGPIEVVVFPADGAPESRTFDIGYEEYKDKQGVVVYRAIMLSPVYPLKERTPAMVLVRKTLLDAEGAAFSPSPASEVLLGLREPFGTDDIKARFVTLRDATQAQLAKMGTPPAAQDLAAAVMVTTGTQESTLFQAAQKLESETPEVNLDPDEDGAPNLLAPSDYYTGDSAVIGLVITGTFKVPDFRDAGGHMPLDADGNVSVQSYRWAEFFILLPYAPASGKIPMVILQHGINSWKETMLDMAESLVGRGFAVAGFDFVHHAKGTDGGFKFLPIDQMGKAADNFRQSALDVISFRNSLEKLFAENDFADVDGNNLPDPSFDKVIFSGHSLGAIESTIAAAIYAGSGSVGGGLANPGANLQYLMEGKLKDLGLYATMPGQVMVGMKATGSQLMSNMDPGLFAPYLQTSPWPGHSPIPFVLILSTKDATIYPICGLALTRAMDSPLLTPVVESWPGVPEVSAEGRTFGTVQFDAAHETITHDAGDPLVDQMQSVLYNFMTSYLTTDTPSISWPLL